jgi:hypothetical protein
MARELRTARSLHLRAAERQRRDGEKSMTPGQTEEEPYRSYPDRISATGSQAGQASQAWIREIPMV